MACYEIQQNCDRRGQRLPGHRLQQVLRAALGKSAAVVQESRASER